MIRWRIREVAHAKGVTISELAKRAGVNRQTIAAFWHDPCHRTTTEMWGKIADALGVSLAEVVEEEQDESEEKAALKNRGR